jgi:hypothetical protein
VSVFDSRNILEVHDVVHLLCIMFLWASSRVYIHLYIAEKGGRPILSKHARFFPNMIYICSVVFAI